MQGSGIQILTDNIQQDFKIARAMLGTFRAWPAARRNAWNNYPHKLASERAGDSDLRCLI